MKLFNNKRANAFAWITVFVGLFVVSIIYTVLAKPWQDVYDQLYPSIQGTQGEDAVNKMVVVYKIFPLIVVLGIFLWGFTQMIRRDTTTELDQGFFGGFG